MQRVADEPTLAAAALRYANLGIPVFPCVPGGKQPLTPNGFHDATSVARVVHAWWQRTPDANIGLPTGRTDRRPRRRCRRPRRRAADSTPSNERGVEGFGDALGVAGAHALGRAPRLLPERPRPGAAQLAGPGGARRLPRRRRLRHRSPVARSRSTAPSGRTTSSPSPRTRRSPSMRSSSAGSWSHRDRRGLPRRPACPPRDAAPTPWREPWR